MKCNCGKEATTGAFGRYGCSECLQKQYEELYMDKITDALKLVQQCILRRDYGKAAHNLRKVITYTRFTITPDTIIKSIYL